jgi:hypothetical protein
MNKSGIEFNDIFKKYMTKELNLVLIAPENNQNFVNYHVDSYEPLFTMEYNHKKPLFVCDLLADLERIYRFSEYYEILYHNGINTPKSYLYDVSVLFDCNKIECLNKFIESFSNQEVFARLDSCSSKPTTSFKTCQEILSSLDQSERTIKYLHEENHKFIIREFIDMSKYYELRCFVYQHKCRGITCPVLEFQFTAQLKKHIIEFIDKIIYFTEYDSCTIDICISISNSYELLFIEINSPVWLFATSGLFDLSNSYDFELLLGEDQSDILSYPEIRYLDKYNNIIRV